MKLNATQYNTSDRAFPLAPIESVLIAGGVSTTPDGVETEVTSELSLVFIEGTLAPLRCSATGGYPPPDITIQLGQEDITNQLSLGHSVKLTGNRSLRYSIILHCIQMSGIATCTLLYCILLYSSA